MWYIQNDCKYLVVFWNRMSLEKALFLFQNVWRHGLWLAEPARRKTSVIFGAICRKQSNYTKTYVIREYGISSLDSNVLLILEITFPREVGLGVGYYHTLCLFSPVLECISLFGKCVDRLCVYVNSLLY